MDKSTNFFKDLKDKSNMETAFEVYGNRLLGFINSYLKDIRLAEDVMMDVFVELIVKHPIFESELQFRTYVFKTAKNKSINQIKRNKHLVQLDEELLKDTIELESLLFDSALDKKLNEVMAKLNYKYRQVLYLCYFEGMEVDEIAQVLGVKPRAATNLKHRAKKKLNEVLKKENFLFKFKEER